MESLLVSPVVPDAAGDGRERRAYAWVRELSAGGPVHLLVVAGPGYRARERNETGPLPLASVRRIDVPRPRMQELRALAWTLAGRRGAASRLFWTPLGGGHAADLERWYGGSALQRVVCFRLYVSEFALRAASVAGAAQVELDLDDVESETWASIAARMRRNGDVLSALRAELAARQFRQAEDENLARFRRVAVCSEQDRQRLARRFPGLAIDVRPNRLRDPGPASPVEAEEGGSPGALFVGSLDYYPNADAVRFFVDEALPLLRGEGWTFAVAGFGSAVRLRREVGSKPGVRWLGAVGDLGACHAAASVVVAPLRAGGGTKVKVIEALLRARPLVATAEAVRGLGLRDGEHYLAAETGTELAAGCRRIAADADLAARLAREGRRAALERFVVAGEEWPTAGATDVAR